MHRKRLAAAMQAHIAVRSAPGSGSTFALLAPLADARGAESGSDARGAASDDQPALAVLVAERCGIIRSSGPP